MPNGKENEESGAKPKKSNGKENVESGAKSKGKERDVEKGKIAKAKVGASKLNKSRNIEALVIQMFHDLEGSEES